MSKKYFVLALITGMLNLLFAATTFAGTNDDKKAAMIEKKKAEIVKLAAATGATVEIKLKDNTKIDGYISEIKDKSFVVIDPKTKSPTEIPYSEVKQTKGHNHNRGLLIGAIIIGAVIVVGVVAATRDR